MVLSNFEHLPNEIQLIILNSIEALYDVLNCRLVSRRYPCEYLTACAEMIIDVVCIDMFSRQVFDRRRCSSSIPSGTRLM
jgi:hypothetical protein